MTNRQSYFEFLIINSSIVVFLSLIYFLWLMPKGLATFVFVVGNLYWFIRSRKCFLSLFRRIVHFDKNEYWGIGFALVALCFNAVLVFFAMSLRTDVTLISPWNLLPPICFVFYGLSWVYSIIAWRYLNVVHGWLLAIVQYVIAFSLIAIIYKLGFGYDFFVHEATLNYIFAHGKILPKQPFYIGQYMSLLPWLEIFRIKINLLQFWFLPILSAILLATSLKEFYKLNKPDYWVVGLMLFAPLTFTVPYNYGLLLLVIVVILVAMDEKVSKLTAVPIALAAAFIHPLVGIPAVCLVSLSFINLKSKKILYLLLIVILSTSSLYGSLLYYNFLHGGQLIVPSFTIIIDSLKILFSSPARFSWEYPWLSLLYVLYALWPHGLFLLGSYGLYKKADKNVFYLLFGGALGIFVAAVLAASSLRYQNIIVHEQYEFSYRLISLMPWLVLPGLFLLAASYRSKIIKIAYYILFTIVVGFLLIANWYVSYPQYNSAMFYYMPSISKNEIEVVDWIELEIGTSDYTALAPQLVSAAALRRVGFEKSIKTVNGEQYPYPIPTGGELYRIYLDFLSGRDIAGSLAEARDFSDSEFLVVVIPFSWDPYNVLNDYLVNIAKKRTIIGDMGVYIVEE